MGHFYVEYIWIKGGRLENTSLEQCVRNAIDAVGLSLYACRVQQSAGTVVVYIDRTKEDMAVDVEDCSRATKQLQRMLSVEFPGRKYRLEVSSPGIERPLFTREHYLRYHGEMIAFKLKSGVSSSKKRMGRIMKEGDDVVVCETGQENQWRIEQIAQAYLVNHSRVKGKA